MLHRSVWCNSAPPPSAPPLNLASHCFLTSHPLPTPLLHCVFLKAYFSPQQYFHHTFPNTVSGVMQQCSRLCCHFNGIAPHLTSFFFSDLPQYIIAIDTMGVSLKKKLKWRKWLSFKIWLIFLSRNYKNDIPHKLNLWGWFWRGFNKIPIWRCTQGFD